MKGTIRDLISGPGKEKYLVIDGDDGRIYFGLPKPTANAVKGQEVVFELGDGTPDGEYVLLTDYALEKQAIKAKTHKKPKPWHFTSQEVPRKSRWVWGKDKADYTVYPVYYYALINSWFTIKNGVIQETPPYIWRTMRTTDEIQEDKEGDKE